jgi:DNA-binding MarR family transcriptional regulator
MHVHHARKMGHMAKTDDVRTIAGTLGTLLLRSNRAHLYQALIGSREGLDESTYPVLSGLARIGPATATELAEQIGLDRTVTTRHASRLENAGLLTRRPHDGDARATTLELTEQGQRCIAHARTQLDGLLLKAMADWPAERIRAFARDFELVARQLAQGSDRP